MSQFFQELKRRKVLKTLGVYGAAAFIIIQVADIVFPRLLLPDWTATFVIILVILGFPLTVLLSWTYDLKREVRPENKKDSVSEFMDHAHSAEPSAKTVSPTQKKSNLSIYTITGAVLACIGIGFWFFFSTSSLSIADENFIENSIAVFSFEDRTPEDKKSNIGVILQDLIISDLSGLTHLKVISSQRLFDIQKQMAENREDKYAIAQLANAKVLLSGSIMDLSGKKILVGDLIDAINGNVIESHRIEGDEIYSMVDKLTDKIRQSLDISKHIDDQLALEAGSKTSNSIEAYDKYLEGLKYLNEINFELADAKFQEAIAIDATFFDAHYLSLISQGWMDDSNRNKTTVNHCQRIIDDKIYKDDDQKLKIEGLCLYLGMHYEEAQIIYEKFVEDDPDDKKSWYTLGEIYYHQKQHDDENIDYNKADSAFKKVLALDPDFLIARIHIMDILFMAGKFDQIIKEEKKHLASGFVNIEIYENLIRSYEALEDSINAEIIKEKAQSFLSKDDLCGIYVKTGRILGYGWEGFLNRTQYHIRRAIKYYQEGQNFCIESSDNPSIWSKYDASVASITLSYKLRPFDERNGRRLYNNQINLIKDKYEKMIISYKVGVSMYVQQSKRPTGDYKIDLPIIIDYLQIALDYSKELGDKRHYTEIISFLLGVFKDQNNTEYALSYFRNEIIDFCGPIDMLTCLAPGNKLNDLAHRFYWSLQDYDEATKIYQYLTDKANLSSLEGNAKNEVIANLQVFYYRLGMMNLKRYNYYTARQNFIAGIAALKENISNDNVDQNWVDMTLLNSRIALCYYEENNFINAIKYFKEAYYATDIQWRIDELAMLALSEYLDNQVDSSKVHFQEVEKYYADGKINYSHGHANYFYIDWPLYLYHKSEGNTNKAQQYLTDAYNHIPEDERKQYLEDNDRLEHQHQYYYIHEIIDTYNQNIR